MENAALFLVTFGFILALGLAADFLGKRTRLPRVTLLLLFGIVIGPGALALVPAFFIERFDLISSIALVLVGFLLGEKLTLDRLRKHGREIITLSAVAAAGTSAFVAVTLMVFGVPVPLALVLGGLAAATDPAATADVTGRADGQQPFSLLLLSVVALDDAWGLVVFSLCVAAAASLQTASVNPDLFIRAGVEIFGAVGLGLAIGLPGAMLSGRTRSGEPILTEALALVFLCGGLAMYFEVSYLIAAMAMGATVANVARHHERPFHAIEAVDWPVMILFFILAGASLDLSAVVAVGGIGAIYVAARIVGKVLSGWVGGRLAGSDGPTSRWIGAALLPQAGVAMGMALVAAIQLPQYRQSIISIAVGSTVLFELLGPIATRFAIRKTTQESARLSTPPLAAQPQERHR